MSFEKLTLDFLQGIIPVLKTQLPKTSFVLNIINRTLKGDYEKNDLVELFQYKDAEEVGVESEDPFIVIKITRLKMEGSDPYSVIYSPEVLTDKMIQAFTNLYDWSKSLINAMGCVAESFIPILEQIAEKNGAKISKFPSAEMYLSIEDAMKLNIRNELEDDFELDKLSPEHALKVKSIWKFGDEFTLKGMTEVITVLGSVGIFKRDKESKEVKCRNADDLVSWCFSLHCGTLNGLHTLEEYRRKGLGKWTLETAAKWTAENGNIPLCNIEHYNHTSRALVEKIGFKYIRDIFWIDYIVENS